MVNTEEVKVNTEEEKTVFNLDNETDKEELNGIIGSGNSYLKMKNEVTYKIQILSPNVETKTATYEDGSTSKRFQFDVLAKCSNGDNYEGVWEVGVGIMRDIFKSYEKDAVYTATKTGSGLDTKYNVVKDF
jgi:hypothetical protein